MEINKGFREQIFEIIENQMRDDDPPETRFTLNRLKNEGFSDFEAKQFIGQCVACELSAVMKTRMPYNEKRYVRNLNNLPQEPTEQP